MTLKNLEKKKFKRKFEKEASQRISQINSILR